MRSGRVLALGCLVREPAESSFSAVVPVCRGALYLVWAMNIPNLLTLVRIFFVPLLVAALVQEKWFTLQIRGMVITNEWMALAIFWAAAATDLLDGYLARRWAQVPTIGTLLDPIA